MLPEREGGEHQAGLPHPAATAIFSVVVGAAAWQNAGDDDRAGVVAGEPNTPITDP